MALNQSLTIVSNIMVSLVIFESEPLELKNTFKKKKIQTLSIPNILGLLSDSKDISKSVIEIVTKEPSIMFHPDDR